MRGCPGDEVVLVNDVMWGGGAVDDVVCVEADAKVKVPVQCGPV